MVQRRGSAIMLAATVLVGLLVQHCEVAEAATFTVGGAGGWFFDSAGWPKGKIFKAGDILVFNYSPLVHNVVVVDKAGYKTCSTPRGAKTYTTGKDRIKLVKGQNFFICTHSEHCLYGMKIAVTAI